MASHSLDYTPYPTAQPMGAPGDDYLHIQATPESFGGGVAKAEEGLGQSIEKTSTEGFGVLDTRAHLTNEIMTNDRSTTTQQQQSEAWGQFSQLQGQAAVQALPTYLDQQKKIADSAISAAPNLESQALLTRSMRNTQSYYVKVGQSHADQQLTTWHTKSSQDAVEDAANQATLASFNNPQMMDMQLNRAADEARKPLELAGWDTPTIDTEVKKTQGKILNNIVQNVALGDGNQPGNPTLARTIADKYMDRIDSGSILNINRFLAPKLNAQRGQQITDEEMRRPVGSQQQGGQTFTPDKMETYLDRVKQIENPTGNPAAVSSTGATGDFQFIRSTWAQYGVGDPTNPSNNRDAARRLTTDNYQALQSGLGRAPTGGELYLAHQQGSGGALALLAHPDQNAVQVLASTAYANKANPLVAADQAIRVNGGNPGMTAGQFAQKWTGRFDGTHELPPGVADRATATARVMARTSDNPMLQQAALAYLSQQYNAIAQETSGLTNQIQQAQKQLTEGTEVPQTQWNQLQQNVQATRVPELQEKFDTADEIRNMFTNFKGQSPADIEAAVTNLHADASQSGATPRQFAVAQAGSTYLQRLRKDVSTDPISRGAQDGVISSVQALDPMGDSQKFQAALSQRIPQAERVSSYYHAPVRFLQPAEKTAFKEMAEVGGAPMLAASSAIVRTLGPQAPTFFREVGGDAPQFAQMGRLQMLGAAPSTLQDLATYQRLASDKDASKQIPKLPEGTLQSNASANYSTAFQAMPGFGVDARAAAQRLIEIRAMRAGIDPKDMPNAEVSKAFQEAAGATFDGNTQYGGVGRYKQHFYSGAQNVPVPSGVNAASMGDVIGAIHDQDLAAAPPVAGDLKGVIPVSKIASGYLVAVAHGAYAVALGDPAGSDPQWVMNQSGGRYILDVDALAPTLRARVPNAYRAAQ